MNAKDIPLIGYKHIPDDSDYWNTCLRDIIRHDSVEDFDNMEEDKKMYSRTEVLGLVEYLMDMNFKQFKTLQERVKNPFCSLQSIADKESVSKIAIFSRVEKIIGSHPELEKVIKPKRRKK